MRHLFCLLFLSASLLSYAQQDELLTLGLTANSYTGDLSSYQNLNPGFSLGLKLQKNKRLNGHFQLGVSEVSGSAITPLVTDNNGVSPANRFFKSTIVSFHFEGHINIIKKERWSVYFSQGFGMMRFNPMDEFGNELINQGASRRPTETYGRTAIWLPSGIGGQFMLNEDLGFSAQIGFRNPQTDYLDNISEYGNPNKNDQILFIQIAFLHKINLRNKRE
jgi:hypothetical protein